MLSIDRLTIRLPAGYASEPVARQLADHLAETKTTSGSREEVAANVAAAVTATLERSERC